MKVGVAASLVGAIVGELPTGGGSGLGVRLLTGSYNGQTIQIWSALFGRGRSRRRARRRRRPRRAAGRLAHGGATGMSGFERILAIAAGIAALVAIALPLGVRGDTAVMSWAEWPVPVFALAVHRRCLRCSG